MITGKATREFVPPKCNRGEFGHHARRQSSIGHSHTIPTYETARQSEASRARGSEPPPQLRIAHHRQRRLRRHCSYLYSGTKSLVHSHWVCPTHLQLAHTVYAHALYGWWHGRPAVRTAVKTYVPTLWGVGSHHLLRLLFAVLIFPLPQLARCSRTPCRSAKLLLSRTQPRISNRGLRNVSTRRG